MKISPIPAIFLGLISLSLPACDRTHAEDKEHLEHQKIVVTSPLAKDIVVTQQYVCQIRSQKNTEICAIQEGYLEEIPIKEGQVVKKGEVLFKVRPVLYLTRLEAERAEATRMQIKYDTTLKLNEGKNPVVSEAEVRLAKAELDAANAKVRTAEAELRFATILAPYDGIIDRQNQQEGSLVKKDACLTTISDNSVMWVYFNVPEAAYLDFKVGQKAEYDADHKSEQKVDHKAEQSPGHNGEHKIEQRDEQNVGHKVEQKTEQKAGRKNDEISHLELLNSRIELVLAGGRKFPYSASNTVTITGKFNNETGTIPFRADFPNPERLLRHGQTGNILIHQTVKNAIVIPQRATFEVLDKRYVYVVGEDHVVHQRLITIQHELDDIFVIASGISVHDKIILEGGRQVHEGEKVPEFEFRSPEEALANQKNHAE